VKQRRKPNEREGKPKMQSHIELATAYVDNPEWRPDRHGMKAFPRKITAMVNVRESAIATLAARRAINDAQVAAANRFRSLWEKMGGTGAGAIDYSREHVDGGYTRDPISQAQMTAGKELARCRALLGRRTYTLVVAVCGEGFALKEIAIDKRGTLTAADNLRDGLDDLAEMWGYQGRARKRA
jgi:hypothetical protein